MKNQSYFSLVSVACLSFAQIVWMGEAARSQTISQPSPPETTAVNPIPIISSSQALGKTRVQSCVAAAREKISDLPKKTVPRPKRYLSAGTNDLLASLGDRLAVDRKLRTSDIGRLSIAQARRRLTR
jgi:hypothetical protein